MKRLISIVALMLATSGIASARCITNDSWTGVDKNKHLAVGAAIGSVATLVFKDADNAFLTGVAVGLAKEIYDSRGHGTCSAQDFAVTALGAAAGAYGTAWIISPKFVGVNIRF
jgi:uncharacterized protein YfiM (DUF2279 family)